MDLLTMKNSAPFLLLLFLSSPCSLLKAADLYTEKELEAVEVGGVHLGDTLEEANQAIANFFSIKPEYVKRSIGQSYPEFLDENVYHLKYKRRKIPYELTVALDIDLDRKDFGYLTAGVVRFYARNADGAAETQKVVNKSIEKTIKSVGPATFVKDVDGTTTYYWCSKLNKIGDSCDNNFAVARMGYRVDLTNPKYKEKFNAYLEKKSQEAASVWERENKNPFTADELAAAMRPIQLIYNDENIATDTATQIFNQTFQVLVNRGPCPKTPEFRISYGVSQSGKLTNGSSKINRAIYVHSAEANTIDLFSSLKDTEVGCIIKGVSDRNMTVTNVESWLFNGLDAVTIQVDPVKKNQRPSNTTHWVRKGNIVVQIRLNIGSDIDPKPAISDAISTIDTLLND